MRKLHGIVVSGLFMSGCFWACFASTLHGQPEPAAKKPEAGAAADAERELNIRYAEAYLKMMEATLERHLESNRVMANTVRPSVIENLQSAVAKARDRVELARGDESASARVLVTSAEGKLRMAEEVLRRAEAANNRRARAVADGEIARLRSEVDLAKVRVEKARHLASESALSTVNYELEQLREDVQELQMFVLMLRRN